MSEPAPIKFALDLTGGWTMHLEREDGTRLPLSLRPATRADIPTLERWDLEPHVISASSDDPDAAKAFGEENDWVQNIDMHQDDVWEHWIAEVANPDGSCRPIGAMQMCDPHLEPTHYWGDVAPDLRALDIWIGDAADRGQGHGELMMKMGIARCFAKDSVTAIIIDPLNSNTRAHAFYQRLGFVPTHRQTFNDEDDCLVHMLTRADWFADSNTIQGD